MPSRHALTAATHSLRADAYVAGCARRRYTGDNRFKIFLVHVVAIAAFVGREFAGPDPPPDRLLRTMNALRRFPHGEFPTMCSRHVSDLLHHFEAQCCSAISG
jgi:hypothetical protein